MKDSELIRKAIELLEKINPETMTMGRVPVITPSGMSSIIRDLLFMEYQFQKHERWMIEQTKVKPHTKRINGEH